MISVLADHNIEGQAALLWSTMLTSGWLDFDLFRLVTFRSCCKIQNTSGEGGFLLPPIGASSGDLSKIEEDVP
jgi:hypothetical protein